MFVGLYFNLSVQVLSAGGWKISRLFLSQPSTSPPTLKPACRFLAMIRPRPKECYPDSSMKSTGPSERRDQSDFYTNTLAPLQPGQRALRIHATDVLMMTVLFLEMAVLVRFLLAN